VKELGQLRQMVILAGRDGGDHERPLPGAAGLRPTVLA
jgi:hypothetical protein